MKTYQTFISEKVRVELLNTNKIYYIYNPKTTYDYIIVLENDTLKGIVNRGFQDDNMESKNINTIGTIWGPGVGDLLYAGLIKKFGKIIPSKNISDQAKINWKRKFNDPDYTTSKIDGIGFYSVYDEEQILNTVIDLTPEIKKLIIVNEYTSDMQNFDKICDDIKVKHDFMTNEFIGNKEDNYSFGESRDRFEWMEEKMKKENKLMKTHIKDSKKFFQYYKIPFTSENNQMAQKFLNS